jgi:hypothetical protein
VSHEHRATNHDRASARTWIIGSPKSHSGSALPACSTTPQAQHGPGGGPLSSACSRWATEHKPPRFYGTRFRRMADRWRIPTDSEASGCSVLQPFSLVLRRPRQDSNLRPLVIRRTCTTVQDVQIALRSRRIVQILRSHPSDTAWHLGQNLGWRRHGTAVFQSAAMTIDESA